MERELAVSLDREGRQREVISQLRREVESITRELQLHVEEREQRAARDAAGQIGDLQSLHLHAAELEEALGAYKDKGEGRAAPIRRWELNQSHVSPTGGSSPGSFHTGANTPSDGDEETFVLDGSRPWARCSTGSWWGRWPVRVVRSALRCCETLSWTRASTWTTRADPP